jgi:ceramide kinase
MYRIVLHTFWKSESDSCKWVPKVFVFGHSNAKDAQEWVQKSQNLLDHDTRRPKRLLVFINPYGGKGLGVQIWEKVAPLFNCAKVETKVVKTERSGHAHGIMKHASKEELNALDGVIVVVCTLSIFDTKVCLYMHRNADPGVMFIHIQKCRSRRFCIWILQFCKNHVSQENY